MFKKVRCPIHIDGTVASQLTRVFGEGKEHPRILKGKFNNPSLIRKNEWIEYI